MILEHAVEGGDQLLDLGVEDVRDLPPGGELGKVGELLLYCLFELLDASIF